MEEWANQWSKLLASAGYCAAHGAPPQPAELAWMHAAAPPRVRRALEALASRIGRDRIVRESDAARFAAIPEEDRVPHELLAEVLASLPAASQPKSARASSEHDPEHGQEGEQEGDECRVDMERMDEDEALADLERQAAAAEARVAALRDDLATVRADAQRARRARAECELAVADLADMRAGSLVDRHTSALALLQRSADALLEACAADLGEDEAALRPVDSAVGPLLDALERSGARIAALRARYDAFTDAAAVAAEEADACELARLLEALAEAALMAAVYDALLAACERAHDPREAADRALLLELAPEVARVRAATRAAAASEVRAVVAADCAAKRDALAHGVAALGECAGAVERVRAQLDAMQSRLSLERSWVARASALVRAILVELADFRQLCDMLAAPIEDRSGDIEEAAAASAAAAAEAASGVGSEAREAAAAAAAALIGGVDALVRDLCAGTVALRQGAAAAMASPDIMFALESSEQQVRSVRSALDGVLAVDL